MVGPEKVDPLQACASSSVLTFNGKTPMSVDTKDPDQIYCIRRSFFSQSCAQLENFESELWSFSGPFTSKWGKIGKEKIPKSGPFLQEPKLSI